MGKICGSYGTSIGESSPPRPPILRLNCNGRSRSLRQGENSTDELICYVEHAWTRMNMNDHCIICISLLSFLEFRDLICMVQSLMLFIFCMTKAGRLAVVALARTTASTWAPENRASPNSMLDQHFSPSTLPKLGVYHDIPHSWTYHPKS